MRNAFIFRVTSPLLFAGILIGAISMALVQPAAAQERTPLPTPHDVPAGDASKYLPIPAPADPSVLGVGVQRTMRLLATSTESHRNRVRIVFYGQSITEQDWTKQVTADLKKRFPNADLDIRNLAIGGFAAQWLIRPAEHDIYPLYPDLMIFHVFGANGPYEEIIKNTRSRTTSEVLMQKDHATSWPQADTKDQTNKGAWWDAMMNQVFLPQIARKYGCGLVDVRTAWIDYLKASHLQPKELTVDGTHLNAQGNYLMAGVISQYLVYRPELPAPADKTVRDVAIDATNTQADGHVKIAFTGNRIDAIAAGDAAATAKVDVLIDGKHPSEYPECYAITRPTPGAWSPLFIRRVDHDKPLVLEHWTYRVSKVNADKTWAFEISGSVTGPDGAGTSDKPFISNSGRVKIAPDDYFRGHNAPLPEGYSESWDVVPLFTDTYTAPRIENPASEYATTLAQGLTNGHHTLELIPSAGAAMPIKAVRVYEPPVPVTTTK